MDIDNVDLIGLEQGWGGRINPSWLRLPLYHDMSRKLMYMNPGMKKVQLTREYDLFISIFQDYWDLPYINAIDGWRTHCKTSVCWLDEMWAANIPGYKYWLRALDQFDYIFVGFKGSVEPLSRAIGRPCYWLPGGADILRFSPYPHAPTRAIDVYSVGRRQEGVHQALVRAAEAREIFYIYDTFAATNSGVYDHRQHRELYANVAKRSRCFTVAPGRFDDPETGGQIEVGYRYYEGAAAGTVMIGQAPDCEAFRRLFDWQDAVIPIQPDGSDVIAVLEELKSDPDRVSGICRRNAVEALRRHDWVYRWKEMFRVVGIDPLPAMAMRERRLKELTDLVSDAAPRMLREA